MKWIVAALALMLALPAQAAEPLYQWRVVGVTDGDTLKVELPGLPAELQPLKVRVRGIDTPESGGRAKCAREKTLAAKATALTRFLLDDARTKARPVTFSEIAWDKYGGRIDARVAIDGRSLGDTLIRAGLARAYDGGKRKGWCG